MAQRLAGSVPPGADLGSWLTLLASEDLRGPAWCAVLPTVLVPRTEFFRHPEQLLSLRARIFKRPRPGHVWSAACATGEEAFSLAACLGEDTRVVGTDLCQEFLGLAAAGRYPRRRFDSIPLVYRREFQEVAGGIAIRPKLHGRVRFQWSDLTDPASYPERPRGGWDAILCRNALFYFEPRRRREVLRFLARELSKEGVLFLGPAEQVTGIGELRLLRLAEGVYAYQRPRRPESSLGSSEPAKAVEPEPLFQIPPQVAEGGASWDGSTSEGGSPRELLVEAAALELDDPEAAKALLGQAAAEADLDANLHWEVGRAFRRLGEPALAVEALRRALLFSPDLWEAAFLLAGALFDLGRYREAQGVYERTRRLVAGATSDPESNAREADATCRDRIARCIALQGD